MSGDAAKAASQRPLWTCPVCGQSFVGRNMAHSCVRLSEDDFFAGREAQRALYQRVSRLRGALRPISVNINKTRISFQARARFASVNRVTRDGLACHLWLKRRLESPRFTRIEHLPPGDYVPQFQADRWPASSTRKWPRWIAEAYEVGMQRWSGSPERAQWAYASPPVGTISAERVSSAPRSK